MKTLLIFAMLIFSNFLFVIAQTSNTEEIRQRELEQLNQRRIAEQKQRADFDRLQQLKNIPDLENYRTTLLRRGIEKSRIEQVYRMPNQAELNAVAPETQDLIRFAEFLRQPKTGLIKLMDGKGCIGEHLVIATADCLQYSMPGAAASYSFRIPNYRIEWLADLTFEDKNFKCLGRGVQGILTSLRDVPLETVNLQTSGLNFLVTFKPETENKNMKESRNHFLKGVLKDGFTYRSEWQAIENTTYILRSIAYKGKQTITPDGVEVSQVDKRKDIIIAFRVIRKSEDGSMTILWKELTKKGAPNLK